jgi:ABC-type sugar transport system substrate-binding protein
MNAIMDAFTADPTLNAIYLNGGMFDGTVQALKNIDKWAPIGEPDHVYWFAQDLFPAAAESIRSGHLHGVGMNDPWAHGDAGAKAALLITSLGKTPPTPIITPVEFIDLSNIDTPPWGQPKRWGEYWLEEPNIDNWPILDRSDVGLETPTYQP